METSRASAIEENVDLTPCNSFGIACSARYLVRVGSLADLRRAMEFAQAASLPVKILGDGSNVLFVDDFPGLIVRMDWTGVERLDEPGMLRVAAGEVWHDLVKYCLRNQLYGFENLALIPGKVGAAPIQNIGAYGAELAQFVESVTVYDPSQDRVRDLDRAGCRFAYRDSLFKQAEGRHFIVLALTLRLGLQWQPNLSYRALRDYLQRAEPASAATPEQVFDAVCAIRRRKLPDPQQLGNAGSFFKNPTVSQEKFDSLKEQYANIAAFPAAESKRVKLAAAWLLEELGWRGREQGAVGVHRNHSLVLVNLGGASGRELLTLADQMRDSVKEHFDVDLEPEVQIIQSPNF